MAGGDSARAGASAVRNPTALSGGFPTTSAGADAVGGTATTSSADARLRDLALLRRVRDRIDREFAQPLDVEGLAVGVHMSAGHLSRQFRGAYGESVYQYLMTRRIERAMALLRAGASVTEVAAAVGYGSLGTFATRFRELVGEPPGAYARRWRGAALGLEPCVARMVTRPVRNREARGGDAA